MEKKEIDILREKLIEKISLLGEKEYIKLECDPIIANAVLFNYLPDKRKIFALPHVFLKHIDFNGISFQNFIAQGEDFTGLQGVQFSANELADHSLIDTTLNGVRLVSLDGAKLYHTDFTGSSFTFICDTVCWNKLYSTLQEDKCLFHRRKKYYVDMRYCKFADVSFANYSDSDYHPISYLELDSNTFMIPLLEGADFTGSKNARIYPANLNLENTVLKDVQILGSFSSATIRGANFSGAKGKYSNWGYYKPVDINPQDLKDKDLSNCVLNNVNFTGPLDNVKINGANFAGSSGAVINLATIADPECINNVNLLDTKVIGEDGKELMISTDGKILGLEGQVREVGDNLCNFIRVYKK